MKKIAQVRAVSPRALASKVKSQDNFPFPKKIGCPIRRLADSSGKEFHRSVQCRRSNCRRYRGSPKRINPQRRSEPFGTAEFTQAWSNHDPEITKTGRQA